MKPTVVISVQGLQEAPVLLPVFQFLQAQGIDESCQIRHQRSDRLVSTTLRVPIQDAAQADRLREGLESLSAEYGLQGICFVEETVADSAGKARSYILTILSETLAVEFYEEIFKTLQALDFRIESLHTHQADPEAPEVGFSVSELRLLNRSGSLQADLVSALVGMKSAHSFDFAIQEDNVFRRNKRLIVFDADMTFIQCEVINEIAKLAGKYTEVEQITRKAMAEGDNFSEALRKRVAHLKGLEVEQIEQITRSIPYTEGIPQLITALKRLGYKIGIISGSFDFVIRHIQRVFGIDYAFANQLEVADGRLTGGLVGDIVDSQAKANLLKHIAEREDLLLDQVIAVGDGANDVEMISTAGLGIAFNAKQVLEQQATASLSSPSLLPILHFLGITPQELSELYEGADD